MRWTLQQVVGATRAVPTPGAAGWPGEWSDLTGVSIDTRSIRVGEMFVAIRAERDGHRFVAAAAAAGAMAALVEHATDGDLAHLVVPDTSVALLDLGRAARSRLPGPVVGITGSVGKTSTKDMAAAALAAALRTVASPRSFNNELGLPLTLVNAPEDSEAVVLEMGARGPGHIALLCGVARPDIGVVTSVAAAHTEMFGDLDGVARAKGELVEALPAGGTAVLNGDDPRTRAMASRTSARTILYGVRPPPGPGSAALGGRRGGSGRGGSGSGAGSAVDVVAEDVVLDADLRPTYRLRSPWGGAQVRLEARGGHQVGNSLAAITVAAVAGVPVEAAAAALRHAALSPFRMEVVRTADGATVVNDAYNANPASMAAALHALADLAAERKVAVLGPMAELGPSGPAEHLSIARLAADLGVELIAVGTGDYGVEPVEGPEGAVARIGPIGSGTAVLVKASRVAALAGVAARLVDPSGRS